MGHGFSSTPGSGSRNVGTMVRTADAAGFTGVVVGQRSADLFGPKVVRSMQGSQFHLQCLRVI